MTTNTAQSAYNECAPARFPMNMRAAAQSLGVSQQRLGRVVRFLQIPVVRNGYALLLDRRAYSKAKKALTDGVVKRGRKKKAS